MFISILNNKSHHNDTVKDDIDGNGKVLDDDIRIVVIGVDVAHSPLIGLLNRKHLDMQVTCIFCGLC